ncbi:MAG: hypothetical protein AB7U29_15300 [Desulfobulbus sp.]
MGRLVAPLPVYKINLALKDIIAFFVIALITRTICCQGAFDQAAYFTLEQTTVTNWAEAWFSAVFVFNPFVFHWSPWSWVVIFSELGGCILALEMVLGMGHDKTAVVPPITSVPVFAFGISAFSRIIQNQNCVPSWFIGLIRSKFPLHESSYSVNCWFRFDSF